jgi:uncharacterized membrane protein YcjF (UPF0283 family)
LRRAWLRALHAISHELTARFPARELLVVGLFVARLPLLTIDTARPIGG